MKATARQHADTAKKRKLDRELDEELQDSFPASDPPALTQPQPDTDEPPAGASKRSDRPKHARPSGR
jgi:hypothetical protein